MMFVRKNKDINGTHYIAVDNRTIAIQGRDIYSTKDKKIIEVLKKDTEVKEIKMKKTAKQKQAEAKQKQAEAKQKQAEAKQKTR